MKNTVKLANCSKGSKIKKKVQMENGNLHQCNWKSTNDLSI